MSASIDIFDDIYVTLTINGEIKYFTMVQREGPTIYVDGEEAGMKIESMVLQETSMSKNMIYSRKQMLIEQNVKYTREM